MMLLLSYYCQDREARAMYPHMASPHQQLVITYEVLPKDPQKRQRLLWDGRTVVAVHKTARRATLRILADNGRHLRTRHGRNRPLPVEDWFIAGTLFDIRIERIPDGPRSMAMRSYRHQVSVVQATQHLSR